MTLYDIISTLKDIALTQPMVRTASDGDVYEALNANPSLQYSVFHVTQTSHSTNEGWDNYGLSLFLIDRLKDDNTNRLEIQSRGKETLNNIIYTFCQNFDAEHEAISFTPFTQKFKDNTAGVWCNVNISVLADTICPIDYIGGSYFPSNPTVVVKNLDIQITENGIYSVPEDYTGFGQVTVEIPIQETKDVTFTDNAEYTVYKDDEYAGVKQVNILVNVPIQESKDTAITENGSYTVYKDDGYKGMQKVDINVDVKPNIQPPKSITLTENNTYEVTKDEQYDGLEGVNILVDVKPSLQTKSVTYSDNDTYTIKPDSIYDGLEQVNVTVDIPIQPSKSITVDDNKKYTVNVDPQYKGMQKVDIEVQVPLQDKDITLTGNTNYTITPDPEYKGIENLNVVVDVPLPNLEDEVNIQLDAGTSGTINPSSGYDAIKKVNYIVNAAGGTGKIKIKEGICLSGSTFTTFDGSNWDWSNVHDLSYMFSGCQNLISVPTGLNVKPYTLADMFNGCTNLSDISTLANWDMSNVTAINGLFVSCKSLSDLSPISNWDVSNVSQIGGMLSYSVITNIDAIKNWHTPKLINMNQLFRSNTRLTNVDLSNWDVSNVTNMDELFSMCWALTEVKFGGPLNNNLTVNRMFYTVSQAGTLYYPKEYDYSKIINILPTTWTAVAY